VLKRELVFPLFLSEPMQPEWSKPTGTAVPGMAKSAKQGLTYSTEGEQQHEEWKFG
jgi:hypothetical protein